MTLIVPDCIKERFTAGTDHGGSDINSRGLRYLEWRYDPEPNDCTYTVDYAFLMRNADGSVGVEHDRHLEGLFSESTWLTLLKQNGFDPLALTDSFDRTYFVGYKPIG